MKETCAVIALCCLLLTNACGGARQYHLELTGAGRALSRVTSHDVHEIRPAISPDGTILLFDARTRGERTIVSVDPRSGARRTLYTSTSSESSEAAWGPDGSWFTYTSNAPGSWCLVRALSRSPNAAVAVLVSGEVAAAISTPSVSPDGSRVAFATFIGDRWEIATATIDGSNFTILGEGYDPEWSPDGQRLVFGRRVNERWHIFSVNADTGADVVQITSGDFDDVDPSWSGDGEHIVFSSNRGAKKARKASYPPERVERLRGPFNLYLLRPDGTGLVQLTDGDALALHPVWGRDDWIYFASNQAGNFDIWRLRPGASF